MGIAYAHGGGSHDPFTVKFDFDPTLIFFAIVLVLYILALKHFRGPDSKVKTWQKVLFFTGMFFLILSLSPPIDPLADQLFWMHMVQHLLITLVGVPLILFGVPWFVIIRGAPRWFRKKIYFPILRSRIFTLINGTLGRPIPSLILFEMNFWLWHVPYFYNLALFNDFYHLLEHALFAYTAMLLWRNVIDPTPLRSPLPLPGRMLFVGAMATLDIILSALLTFTEKVWYGYEGLNLPAWWRWGHLEDQKVGALIMWVIGGMIYFFAMTVIFFVWAKRNEAQQNGLSVTPSSSTING
jgi:putative membrane protein